MTLADAVEKAKTALAPFNLSEPGELLTRTVTAIKHGGNDRFFCEGYAVCVTKGEVEVKPIDPKTTSC